MPFFLTPCCSLHLSHTLLIETNSTAMGIGIMYSGVHFQCNTWMWFQEFMNSMNKSIKRPPKAQSAWKFILIKVGTFFGCTFVSMWPSTLQQNRYFTLTGNRVTQSVMRVVYLCLSFQSSYTVSFQVLIFTMVSVLLLGILFFVTCSKLALEFYCSFLICGHTIVLSIYLCSRVFICKFSVNVHFLLSVCWFSVCSSLVVQCNKTNFQERR